VEATPEGALALRDRDRSIPAQHVPALRPYVCGHPLARDCSDRAITRRFDQLVATDERSFFYLHSCTRETLADQERSMALYRAAGDAYTP